MMAIASNRPGLVLCAAMAALSLQGAQGARAAQPAPPAATATAPSTATGHQLFIQMGCYQCHGYAGQGSIMSGPALVPQRLPLAALQAYVRHPSGQMPPFSQHVLSDTQLSQIYAYLASLPVPLPPSRIPLLRLSPPYASADFSSHTAQPVKPRGQSF
jgi:cytochrome c553